MVDPSLAAERTALAWQRTSMSFLVVTALSVRVLARDAPVTAVAITVAGCVAAFVAWRHLHIRWARPGIAIATASIAALVAVAAFTA